MNDDKKLRLLKIQSSLLQALALEKDKTKPGSLTYEESRIKLYDCLNKYKELVTEIDNDIYKELQEKITEYEKLDLSLEEELIKLEEITTAYNQLIAVENKFKHTYDEYSDTPLTLSNIEELNIDSLQKRKNK